MDKTDSIHGSAVEASENKEEATGNPRSVKQEVTHDGKDATQNEDPMKKWSEELQKRIEAKKQMEAEALRDVTANAKEELEKWRQERKAKLGADSAIKGQKEDVNEKERTESPFDWKKVANMLTKSGHSPNDQNNGPSQKMVDLIFMKAKE